MWKFVSTKTIIMKTRVNIYATDPTAYKALLGLENYLTNSGIDRKYVHLIKLRASQLNGCAFCIDMHTKEARKDGETEQRLYLVSAWKEVPIFSEEEKAVFALTEEITLIQNRLSDHTYENARKYFDEAYIAKIIMAVITINSWNRLAISTEMIPAGM